MKRKRREKLEWKRGIINDLTKYKREIMWKKRLREEREEEGLRN